MDIPKAKKVIADLLHWEVVVNDGDSFLWAIDLQKRYKYSFWDSVILHAALKVGSTVLMSEDLATGQKIKEMTIENPFL